MKNFLLLVLSFFVLTASANDIPVGKITIKGLSAHKNNYLSLYLVSGKKFLGPTPTITKVYYHFATTKITADVAVFGSVEVTETWADSFFKPNHLVAVIHMTKELALNKNPISDGAFQEPEYEENVNIVKPNAENYKELVRKYLQLSTTDELVNDLEMSF